MSKDKQNIDSNRDVTALDGSDQFAVRQEKLNRLRENGKILFVRIGNKATSSEAQALLPEEMEEGPEVSVAGRIVAFRLMGKASFYKNIGPQWEEFSLMSGGTK